MCEWTSTKVNGDALSECSLEFGTGKQNGPKITKDYVKKYSSVLTSLPLSTSKAVVQHCWSERSDDHGTQWERSQLWKLRCLPVYVEGNLIFNLELLELLISLGIFWHFYQELLFSGALLLQFTLHGYLYFCQVGAKNYHPIKVYTCFELGLHQLQRPKAIEKWSPLCPTRKTSEHVKRSDEDMSRIVSYTVKAFYKACGLPTWKTDHCVSMMKLLKCARSSSCMHYRLKTILHIVHLWTKTALYGMDSQSIK